MTELPVNQVNARQGWALAPEEREAMEYDVVIVGAGLLVCRRRFA